MLTPLFTSYPYFPLNPTIATSIFSIAAVTVRFWPGVNLLTNRQKLIRSPSAAVK